MTITAIPNTPVNTTTGTTTLQCNAPALGIGTGFCALVVTYDNSGTNGNDPFSSIATDTAGNTWTSRTNAHADPGLANEGACVRIFTAFLPRGWGPSDSVTITWTASTSAKCYQFISLSTNVFGAACSFRTGSGNKGTTGASTVGDPTVTTVSVNSGELVLAAACGEGSDSWVDDTDTTNGSWSTGSSTASGSNMSLQTQTKVVTATATQTFNPTSTTTDANAAYIIVEEDVDGWAQPGPFAIRVEHPPRRGYFPAASSDDAGQNGTTVSLTGVHYSMDTVNTDWLGIRFPTDVPAGAQILSARLRVAIPAAKSDDFNLRIYAEDADDPGAFTTGASDISNRARTSASVDWVAANQASTAYVTSPDLSAPVQEWVDRAGHTSSSHLALILEALSASDSAVVGYAFDELTNIHLRYRLELVWEGITEVSTVPPAKQITFTHNTPTATGDANVTPAAFQLSFTHNASAATVDNTATPAAHQIGFTHNAPAGSVSTQPSSKQITFTHNASTAVGTSDGNANPAAFQLAFTHNASAATVDIQATPAAFQITFTHNQSTASVGGVNATATPAPFQITFTFTPPVLGAPFVAVVLSVAPSARATTGIDAGPSVDTRADGASADLGTKQGASVRTRADGPSIRLEP